MSKIEWTNRTWNPVTGCFKVSEGCKNCYALRMSHRLSQNPMIGEKYAGTTTKTAGGKANFTGQINLHHDLVFEPLRWKKPAMVFVNSMSDLFHEGIPFDFIEKVFDTMIEANWHTFQVLTKRPERALAFFRENSRYNKYGYKRNIWLGVSVENQAAADVRIPLLLKLHTFTRFLSCEPLLSPVDFTKLVPPVGTRFKCSYCGDYSQIALENCKGCGKKGGHCGSFAHIDWVIVGGESGPGARPIHPDWVRSLRDQCAAHDVSFFFKQWGEFEPRAFGGETRHDFNWIERDQPWQWMVKVGKKAAGALLDGVEHRQFPK